ncbi:MAG: 3-oxoacid CoA-transferase subunit B [Deltaproteobacteria bacterium]|nr:3-oxoacid CoA-transferase subunit B [Deltaproteobacteria bacterium]
MSWSREEMVQQAAAEIRDGMVVNLGIGMPTLVANHVAPSIRVTFQSENGLLGMGPFPYDDEVDPQIINAGKQTVTLLPGGSVFDSAQSFAMLRGGHVDLAILGGLEVNTRGDLANWAVPGKMVTGMGGAMDLAAGARRLIVLQTHNAKDGTSKLRRELTLPVTALRCVSRVITELGVFVPTGNTFVCIQKPDTVTHETIVASTDAPVTFG